MNPMKCDLGEFTNFRHIVLNVPTKDTANYNEIFQVDPQHLSQALRLAKSFQGAITPNDLNFNYEKALEIAKDIPNSGIVNTTNRIIIQQFEQLSNIIEQIKESVRTMLGLSVSSSNFWSTVENTITNTFINLNSQQNEKWVSWKNVDSTNTRYYYNILLSIQNAETGGVIAILPISFDISVNVSKEKLLFFTIKDSARYEVKMKGFTLVQILGFDDKQNNQKHLREFNSEYLLDYEGNPVKYNKPYYMDPSLLWGRGIAYEKYMTEYFVLLENEGSQGAPSGQQIKFVQPAGGDSEYVRIGYWTTIRAVNPPEVEDIIGDGVTKYDIFTYSPLTKGVSLSPSSKISGTNVPTEKMIWIPTLLPEDLSGESDLLNYFAFQNLYTKKYLSYTNTSEKSWLDAEDSQIHRETLWRLIPE